MSFTSRFLNLTDYCMVEFIYSNTNTQQECDVYLVDNKLNNTHQFFASNGIDNVTHNIQDYSAIPYGNNKFVRLDEENDILDSSPSYVKSPLIHAQAFYDTVRYHFVSGIDVKSYAGLVLGVKNLENSGKYNIFSSLLLTSLNYQDLVTFNTNPIYLAGTIYDRYVDVLIPSIKKMNNLYYSLPDDDPDPLDGDDQTKKTTLAAKLTLTDASNLDGNFTGFLRENPITFFIDECGSVTNLVTDDATYEMYVSSHHVEASLPQINEFDLLSCDIYEAADGNYYMYHAKYNGGYPGEFLASISDANSNWVIIHQINVYEYTAHGGVIKSSSITTYQQDEFDSPNLFRPIIKNAGVAVSFSMDYMVRLLNQSNGEQIIRTASTMRNSGVNRYGKNTVAIKMDAAPSAHKVYNRVFKSKLTQSDLFMEPEFNHASKGTSVSASSSGVVERITRYPMYVDYNKISVSSTALPQADYSGDSVVYSQGDLRVILKPFDNNLKFRVYYNSNGNSVPMQLDPVNVYKLVFIVNSRNDKVMFDHVTDENTARLVDGDVVFRIPSVDSAKILASPVRDFYITSYNYSTLQESVVYHGFWHKPSEVDAYNEHVAKIHAKYGVATKNANTLQQLVNSATTGSAGTIPSSVYVPGYVDQSSNNSEVSSTLKLKPRA